MRKVLDILRLAYEGGRSQREIGVSLALLPPQTSAIITGRATNVSAKVNGAWVRLLQLRLEI